MASSSSAKKSTTPLAKPMSRKGGATALDVTYQRAQDNRLRNEQWPGDWGTTIGECLEAYHAEHAHRRKAQRYYVTEALNQFLSVNALDEGMPIGFLDKDRCKVYKAALLGGSAKRTRKPGPVTIARKLSTIHHFVKWALNNDFLQVDIMAGLALPAKLVANARLQKDGFTDEEMSTIFTKIHTTQHKGTEFYWIVMLLAHSGARVTEVLQLLRADIQQEEGIWFMSISGKGEGQQLKNRASVRQVPIHTAVLKAGFLDWYHSGTDTQLFPATFPKGAVKMSLDFSRLLRQLKLKRPALTLHSLRHTVAIRLELAEVHYSKMRRLLGHSIGKAVEDRVYLRSLKHKIKDLAEAVEAIKFSLPPI